MAAVVVVVFVVVVVAVAEVESAAAREVADLQMRKSPIGQRASVH